MSDNVVDPGSILAAILAGFNPPEHTGPLDSPRARLLYVLPLLKQATDMAGRAGPGVKVALGVLATNPDRSGKVLLQFDAEPFFADLAAVLGVADNPEWLSAAEPEPEPEPGTEE